MTADFVMSMSRKVEDKIANTGRFHKLLKIDLDQTD